MVWTFDLPCLPLLCMSCCGGLTCLCLSRNWWNWISKLRRILKGKIVSACYKKRTLSVTFLFFDFIWILKMTNRIWQNFLASNIHRGINKVAAQKSSSIEHQQLCHHTYKSASAINLNMWVKYILATDILATRILLSRWLLLTKYLNIGLLHRRSSFQELGCSEHLSSLYEQPLLSTLSDLMAFWLINKKA